MTTTVGGITEGEVVVEAGTGMIVIGIMQGKEIIIVEAGAAVLVLITIKVVVETGWSEEVGAGQLKGTVNPRFGIVLVPGGAHLHSKDLLPMVKVLTGAVLMNVPHLLPALHPVDVMSVLEVYPPIVLMAMRIDESIQIP